MLLIMFQFHVVDDDAPVPWCKWFNFSYVLNMLMMLLQLCIEVDDDVILALYWRWWWCSFNSVLNMLILRLLAEDDDGVQNFRLSIDVPYNVPKDDFDDASSLSLLLMMLCRATPVVVAFNIILFLLRGVLKECNFKEYSTCTSHYYYSSFGRCH